MFGAGPAGGRLSSRPWLHLLRAASPRRAAGGLCSQKDLPPGLLLAILLTTLVVILFQIFVVHNSKSVVPKIAVQRAAASASMLLQASMTELDRELRQLVKQKVISVEKNTELLLAETARHHGRCCQCHRKLTPETSAMQGLLRRRTKEIGSVITTEKPLPRCPKVSPLLVGKLHGIVPGQAKRVWRHIPWLATPRMGGRYAPPKCQARHSQVIIIPYRDRASHLSILLSHLHPILQRQQLCYRIVVVEQLGEKIFNKAKLMNAAVLESLKMQWVDCFVFHDVDLVPEDDRVPYSCPTYPRHMSVGIDKYQYKLPYDQLVGGVLAMSTKHFLTVNGYSNMFWGWGAEDDDMAIRIKSAQLFITRPNPIIARYSMIRHASREHSHWRERWKLLFLSSKRYRLDGLNSVRYNVSSIIEKPLFTHILIDVGPPPRSVLVRQRGFTNT